MRAWLAVRLIGVAAALLLVAACGEEGPASDLPSRTASITASAPTDRPTSTRDLERTAAPTRDDEETTAAPTRDDEQRTSRPTGDEGQAAEPTGDEGQAVEPTGDEEGQAPVEPAPTTVVRTLERVVTETAQAAPSAAAQPTPTGDAVAGEAATDEDGVPPWAWLLLLAVLAGLGAGAVLLRRRNRRQDWERAFDAAAGEGERLTQQVIPDLARLPTEQQRALTWGAASQRLDVTQDRLAGLAATAADLEEAQRAQTLNQAVRQAQGRLDLLVTGGQVAGLSDALWSVAQDLDAVLAQVRAGAPPVATSQAADPPGSQPW